MNETSKMSRETSTKATRFSTSNNHTYSRYQLLKFDFRDFSFVKRLELLRRLYNTFQLKFHVSNVFHNDLNLSNMRIT